MRVADRVARHNTLVANFTIFSHFVTPPSGLVIHFKYSAILTLKFFVCKRKSYFTMNRAILQAKVRDYVFDFA